jgi:virginiamycin B lyase
VTGVTAGPSEGKVSFYSDPSIVGSGAITPGPDGALWFTNPGNSSIGRITTTGVVSNYTDASISDPWRIVAGPDGALWFANNGNNSIGRITTTGVVTNYTGPGIAGPGGITVGPDGALWFTNTGNDSIGRITTSGVVTNYTGPGIANPNGIVAGPDGAVWFTNDSDPGSIGRITMAGVITHFAQNLYYPKQIVVGPDRALWFTTPDGLVWRITTRGVMTGFPGSDNSYGIAEGPAGPLWFTGYTIGRVTATGTFTIFSKLHGYNPFFIAKGSDGAMWFTNFGGGAIGRITTGETPAITGFTPSSGPPSSQVTITGQHLSRVSGVAVDGVAAAIVSVGANQVVVDVPEGATSGPITATTPAGTATSRSTFDVTSAG